MPTISVYLPDDMYFKVRNENINCSKILKEVLEQRASEASDE